MQHGVQNNRTGLSRGMSQCSFGRQSHFHFLELFFLQQSDKYTLCAFCFQLWHRVQQNRAVATQVVGDMEVFCCGAGYG